MPALPPKGVFPQVSMEDGVLEKLKAKHAVHKARNGMTPVDVIRRWPALVAHLICESLGYATPDVAAMIILDAINGKENWCEWVYSCYKCDPKKPLAACIRNRKGHTGYMSEFKQALAITFKEILTGDSPVFASWF
jgi:hypothetical protein